MSNISSAHDFVQFVSGESKPVQGQRLAKIIYKKTKADQNPLKSVCVSVPKIALTVQDAVKLLPHLSGFVEGVQDRICRNAYESGRSCVVTSELEIDAVIQFLTEEATIGGRFSKAAAKEWCENSGYSDALRLRFAELLGVGDNPTNEQSEQVEQQVSGYVEKLTSLTGSKTWYPVEVCKKLLKSLEISGVTDGVVSKFEARLNDMIESKKQAEEMLNL